ncbi:MAG: glycosyltransferase [Chloroflexi bacterium]|nr:glycosyltransferase [Chloroflexota bacterium]
MAKFLISTMPAIGHVNPFLLTAAKLIERGHEVWWHTGNEVAEKVKATGARFVAMEHTHNVLQTTVEAQRKDGLAAANAAIISLYVAPMLGQLQDYQTILADFSADVVIVDKCSLGAVLLHEEGGPVWASVGISPLRTAESPFYGSGQLPAKSSLERWGNRNLNWFSEHVLLKQVTSTFNQRRNHIGLPSIPSDKTAFDYLMSPFLHLQGTTPAFEFPYRDLPPQIHYVGSMLPPMPTEFVQPSWWAELKSGQPVVHVTQGTVATDTAELVYPTIQALADEDVLVVVTTPEPGKLGRLSSNVRVERMIPHSLLLPHVNVMVTNGGYNGVKTALAYGVPLVAAGATEDKPEVCSRIAWSGTGINLKTGSPTPAQLKQAIREVLHNPSYRQKAETIQADFARRDSPTEAAQLLERLASGELPHLQDE